MSKQSIAQEMHKRAVANSKKIGITPPTLSEIQNALSILESKNFQARIKALEESIGMYEAAEAEAKEVMTAIKNTGLQSIEYMPPVSALAVMYILVNSDDEIKDLAEKLTTRCYKGSKESVRVRQENAATRAEEIKTHWEKLAHLAKRNRASRIAEILNISTKTVRAYLRKAGLM